MKLVINLFMGIVTLSQGFPNKLSSATRESTLIVGGEPAEKNEIPYQIGLVRIDGGHFCGGSILDTNHILTAAHCIIFPNEEFRVHAGEHNIRNPSDDGTEQIRDIENVFVHPDYNNGNGTMANDVAVLRLSTPLEFNTAVGPIALPNPGHISTGNVQTSGWGLLESGGSSPDVLHKVRIPIVEDGVCEAAYELIGGGGVFEVNGEIMICAGNLEEGGQSACNGDSGGPLVAYDDGEYLAGIVSWAYWCALPGTPGVFAEVVFYLDWIQAIINNN